MDKEILKEVGKYVYALRRLSDGKYFGKDNYHQSKAHRLYSTLGHLKTSIMFNNNIKSEEHEIVVFELVEKERHLVDI